MRKLPSKLASKLYGAAELIADRGLDATKIEDIAEATGIPKATLYYRQERGPGPQRVETFSWPPAGTATWPLTPLDRACGKSSAGAGLLNEGAQP